MELVLYFKTHSRHQVYGEYDPQMIHSVISRDFEWWLRRRSPKNFWLHVALFYTYVASMIGDWSTGNNEILILIYHIFPYFSIKHGGSCTFQQILGEFVKSQLCSRTVSLLTENMISDPAPLADLLGAKMASTGFPQSCFGGFEHVFSSLFGKIAPHLTAIVPSIVMLATFRLLPGDTYDK
jgi:hypothetical protein